MAANAWNKYNGFPEYAGDNTIDMDNDTFKMGLYLVASNCADATKDLKAELTSEHANQGAPGYETGGKTVALVAWSHSAGTTMFDLADAAWTATGGSIVCRYAVIYDDTPTSPADPLICWSLLDNAPADITVTAGNTLTIQINASGVLTITGMP